MACQSVFRLFGGSLVCPSHKRVPVCFRWNTVDREVRINIPANWSVIKALRNRDQSLKWAEELEEEGPLPLLISRIFFSSYRFSRVSASLSRGAFFKDKISSWKNIFNKINHRPRRIVSCGFLFWSHPSNIDFRPPLLRNGSWKN